MRLTIDNDLLKAAQALGPLTATMPTRPSARAVPRSQ